MLGDKRRRLGCERIRPNHGKSEASRLYHSTNRIDQSRSRPHQEIAGVQFGNVRIGRVLAVLNGREQFRIDTGQSGKLPKVIDESASADFDVLIVPSGKIEKAVFVHGSELLRNAGTRLQEASFTQVLPKGSTTYLPRRGILSCGSAGCSFVFYRPSVAVSTFGQSISAEAHKDSSTSPGDTAPLGEVFRVGGSITPPRVVYSPQPEYSEQARKAKFQGSCTVGLIVEQDGHTSHIRMLKGIGMGLDENAIAAVQKWKFEPAMKDGNPVRVEIAVEVSFHLYQNSRSPDAKQ